MAAGSVCRKGGEAEESGEEMTGRNIKVTAHLCSPLAGDAPMLDSVLELCMARLTGAVVALRRSDPAPEAGAIHLPMLRGHLGPVDKIPRCSSPIVSAAPLRHEHFAKRIDVANADLLRDDSRLVVAVGNSWTKSYRIPQVVRNVDRVVWFVGGSKRKTLLELLRRVHAIGDKRSQGYGRVAKWTAEDVAEDWSWWANVRGRRILMRPLPFCDELPANLEGYRRDFGACIGPYWHPDRYMEIVVPC